MMSTYTNGYTLISKKDITKKDIIELCELLTREYNNGYTFEPEGITEGGIIFKFPDSEKKLPEFKDEKYKSVRLHFTNCRYGGRERYLCYSYSGEWPWINKNTIIEWKDDNHVLLKEKHTIKIFLKSFHGAPPFTIDELKIWEYCFKKIGLELKGIYPTKKELIFTN